MKPLNDFLTYNPAIKLPDRILHINMRISIIFLILGVVLITNTYAQKIGYVNTDFVLKQMPEYKEAQKELDKLTEKYKKEVDEKFQKVQEMKEAYESEKILLTDDVKQERLDSIKAKEKEAKDYQKKIFGHEGLIFLKRKELIKPVQEKIYKAVETVAKKKNIDILFDKAGSVSMVYTNPVHDYTDYVLQELGMGDKEDEVDNPKYKR